MRALQLLAAIALFGGSEPAEPPAPAPDQPPGTTRVEVLIGTVDLARVASDPDFARVVLERFGLLAADLPPGSAERAAFDGVRAVALATLERRAESEAIVDRIIAGRFADPFVYRIAWVAAAVLRDPHRIVRLLEAAVRHVPADRRAQLFDALDSELVWGLVTWLEQHGGDAERDRVYVALVEIGWPGDLDPASRDDLRLRLLDVRLDGGDRAAAAALARRISAPAQVIRLLTLKRYEGLLPATGDASSRVSVAIDEADRASSRALAERPDDVPALFRRAAFLISVGRAAETIALLQPYLADVRATVESHPQAHWLIDHAAYALLMLGRTEEGVALYRQLGAIPIDVRENLIDTQINYANFLWLAGRPREALAQAERLSEIDGRMNDFGRMWAWSARVCALAGLDRAAEGRAWLERMRRLDQVNRGALMRAFLCLGDMARAEAMMIERLGSDWPLTAVLALQDWKIAEVRAGPNLAIDARLAELRGRPAVAAALARVGRSYSLPLARSYWGSF